MGRVRLKTLSEAELAEMQARCPALRQHGGSPTLKSGRCGNANPCSTSAVRDISRGSTVQAAHSPGACGAHLAQSRQSSASKPLVDGNGSMGVARPGRGGGAFCNWGSVQRCQGRKR